jgi:hypothetical protein
MYHLQCLFTYTLSPRTGYFNIATNDMMLTIGLIIAIISGCLLAMDIIKKYKL